ncbi:hypothetical protein QD460_17965, partial [Rhizobium jaguaris]|uniref:hypothetical protein n=1 Tax=Rhizobium jaguaris TaxID=1312183 RepID=UPI0039BFFA9D
DRTRSHAQKVRNFLQNGRQPQKKTALDHTHKRSETSCKTGGNHRSVSGSVYGHGLWIAFIEAGPNHKICGEKCDERR